MRKQLIFFIIIFTITANLFGQKYDESFFSNMEWRNIGPNRGGRSLSSMGSPGRPNEYYFGATGGGLWKTTDGGNTWFPVTDGQISSSSIGAVAVAETNPDIVYIGGGETQLRGSITQGDGVYKSIDGGKTWKHIGLSDTQAIARIRIHPTNPDIVYVAALGHPYGDNKERGIFRSKDGGKTWKKILYKSPKAGGVDISIDRTNPKVIYASLWQVYRKAWKMWGGGPFSGIYKSTDGGDTWKELTNNSGMPEGPIGKIGMAVSPADPKRVWAVVEASEGGVFRSDDGGKNWERTNDDRKIRQRHFYYSRIVADPLDRETVYALNTRLYKSTDGGVTFDTQISVPHGDNHDLWIDPNDPKRMVNSNDGGGNVTINGGETWTEQDYSTTQLYHVNVTNDFPYHVCGAQQDNSTVCVPSEGWGNMQARGPNHGWYYAAGGGESGYITQHPSKLDIFYAGSQGALLTRYNRATGQIRDIQVYPRFFSGEPASALPERWQWTFPIVFSPLNEKKLYTCSQHVWLSKDDGQSWKKISPDLTYADPSTLGPTGGLITMDMNGPEIYATVFALTPSKHHINTIWAGSDDGLMHITRNGGKTWDNITPPEMEKFTRISIIEESSHKPGTAYVAANRYQVDDRAPYVWRTRDYGKTWTKIVNGVADGHFARAVREDAVKEGLLFLGTEHGVYVSFDAGDSWQPIQLNLPDTPIRDLQLKNSDVVLGTHGRGFWILDDYDPLREYTDRTAVESLTLFTPHDAVRGEETAIVQYFLSEEADSVQTEIYDSKGDLVISMVGDSVAQRPTEIHPWYRTRTTGPPTTAKGLNRWEWNLRYKGATMFEGIIIWSGRPQNGPKAPPGAYEARVTVNGVTKSIKFNIKMDPRLKGVSKKDLKEQYQLASQIRDKTSSANEAVIQIRHIREQINDRLKKTKDQQIGKISTDLIANLTEIEEALYQTKNESGQDPLNFPIRLNNRLASLRRSVENGDAKPTNGAYKVFEELSTELKEHLEAMEVLLTQSLNPLNARLKSKELERVSTTIE